MITTKQRANQNKNIQKEILFIPEYYRSICCPGTLPVIITSLVVNTKKKRKKKEHTTKFLFTGALSCILASNLAFNDDAVNVRYSVPSPLPDVVLNLSEDVTIFLFSVALFSKRFFNADAPGNKKSNKKSLSTLEYVFSLFKGGE